MKGKKKMTKKIMFLLTILAVSSAHAISVTLTKTEQGWTVYNNTYIQSIESDEQGVYVTIGNYVNQLKSGACRVTTLNHTMDNSDMKAKVSCQGQAFVVTFVQYGNTVSPTDVEQGSQVTVAMSDVVSSSQSQGSSSSVPAKKYQPSPRDPHSSDRH